jgi:5S rRNA maturation endonuclease (ribonuclease M5)
MHATYRLRADELNKGFVQTLKNAYQQREIIILTKEDFDEELEKIRHNTVFTEKLQQRVRDLNEGKCIVKTWQNLRLLPVNNVFFNYV